MYTPVCKSVATMSYHAGESKASTKKNIPRHYEEYLLTLNYFVDKSSETVNYPIYPYKKKFLRCKYSGDRNDTTLS